MSLNLNDIPFEGEKRIEPIESGTYPARVVGIAVIGMHEQMYQGEVKPPKREVFVTYELLDEFLKDEEGNDLLDKPRWISERFPLNNLASTKAKSTLRYTALDQEMKYEGDFTKLLGTPCMVTIRQDAGTGKNKGKVFNNISSVSAMRPREAAKAPDLVNPIFFFDFYTPTKEEWQTVPAWMQNVAKEALDYAGSDLESLLSDSTEEPTKSRTRSRSLKVEKEEENGEW